MHNLAQVSLVNVPRRRFRAENAVKVEKLFGVPILDGRIVNNLPLAVLRLC